jgi:hypothetical protein
VTGAEEDRPSETPADDDGRTIIASEGEDHSQARQPAPGEESPEAEAGIEKVGDGQPATVEIAATTIANTLINEFIPGHADGPSNSADADEQNRGETELALDFVTDDDKASHPEDCAAGEPPGQEPVVPIAAFGPKDVIHDFLDGALSQEGLHEENDGATEPEPQRPPSAAGDETPAAGVLVGLIASFDERVNPETGTPYSSGQSLEAFVDESTAVGAAVISDEEVHLLDTSIPDDDEVPREASEPVLHQHVVPDRGTAPQNEGPIEFDEARTPVHMEGPPDPDGQLISVDE